MAKRARKLIKGILKADGELYLNYNNSIPSLYNLYWLCRDKLDLAFKNWLSNIEIYKGGINTIF